MIKIDVNRVDPQLSMGHNRLIKCNVTKIDYKEGPNVKIFLRRIGLTL